MSRLSVNKQIASELNYPWQNQLQESIWKEILTLLILHFDENA